MEGIKKANKPRPCAKLDCWEKGVTGWTCSEHRMSHAVQAGLRILTDHPGAENCALFLAVDTHLSVLLRRLHRWVANDQHKLSQMMYWTFPWVIPRYQAAEALRLQSEDFPEKLARLREGVAEIEKRVRGII